ncbi:MAG: zf-HC2 domain-containing protein [Lutisporaceae bacterium]
MSCEKYEKQISLYIDNELSDEDKKALEQHIEECNLCKQQLQAITYMRDMMGNAAEKSIKSPTKMKKKIYFKIYRALLIMFIGLVILISMVAVSGGLAQMLIFDKIPIGIRIFFTLGITLLIGGLIILLYDVFIDMFKILIKK